MAATVMARSYVGAMLKDGRTWSPPVNAIPDRGTFDELGAMLPEQLGKPESVPDEPEVSDAAPASGTASANAHDLDQKRSDATAFSTVAVARERSATSRVTEASRTPLTSTEPLKIALVPQATEASCGTQLTGITQDTEARIGDEAVAVGAAHRASSNVVRSNAEALLACPALKEYKGLALRSGPRGCPPGPLSARSLRCPCSPRTRPPTPR